jgi:hypothetical protein
VHITPQASGAPPQVAVPLAGVGQGVHEAVVDIVPHVAGLVLIAHTLPQRWYPVLQVIPQTPPVQAATPLPPTGAGQVAAVAQAPPAPPEPAAPAAPAIPAAPA